MEAYKVNPDGFGFTAQLPKTNAFFWSKVTAGNFCEAKTKEYVHSELRRFVENADFQRGFYQTIRKHDALKRMTEFVQAPLPESLRELTSQLLELEPELRAIAPSVKHPYHHVSKSQLDNLIWLCVRIRKQLKSQHCWETKTQPPPDS
jgi:hypothetical protein